MSEQYKIKMYGLRFFTVYGEWGRPDMLLFKIIKAFKEKKTLKLNNSGIITEILLILMMS